MDDDWAETAAIEQAPLIDDEMGVGAVDGDGVPHQNNIDVEMHEIQAPPNEDAQPPAEDGGGGGAEGAPADPLSPTGSNDDEGEVVAPVEQPDSHSEGGSVEMKALSPPDESSTPQQLDPEENAAPVEQVGQQSTPPPPEEEEPQRPPNTEERTEAEAQPLLNVDQPTEEDNPFGVGPLVLPDAAETFEEMRQTAAELFTMPDPDSFLTTVEAHTLEVGTMTMTKDISTMEEEQDLEEGELQAQRDKETVDKIEEARSAVTDHQEGQRMNHTELQWRLREEEVAARERLAYEHQAKEAALLHTLGVRHSGKLQHVPHDPTSWTVEWAESPQEFNCNVTAIRGVRSKVREGYYVLLLSIVDRIGGKTIRFSTGEQNKDCTAALPPLRYIAKTGNIDVFVDRNVDLLCPASILLRTHAALQFELWQLKVGKYDPTDKVIGWGVWPLVNKNFMVVEGRFKIPLLKGPVDQNVDTYRELTQATKENLSRWLGNLYFEIKLRRKSHDATAAEGAALKAKQLEDEAVDAHNLRLNTTAKDFRSLTVPKLPPRLFFDEVSLDKNASSGLRRRHFNSQDVRALNTALWEKRALLEEEREALNDEVMKRKTRSFQGEDGDEDVADWRIRRDLAKTKHTFRQAPSVAEAEEGEQNKCRDSHILLAQHHQSVVSQREFFFLGRRYRDKAEITLAVVLYDFGVNFGGPWDKTKIVTNFIFMLLGFLFRLYVHNAGLYLWLFSLDVPATTNDWSFAVVDIRFAHTTRFYPSDTTLTMMSGMVSCMFFFIFFSLGFSALLAIFGRVPYALTRLMLWLGVMIVLDPLITLAYESGLGDEESHEIFLLYNQLSREEGSALTGFLSTLSIFTALSCLQFLLLYWYIGSNHLNGRVNDIYQRLIFPDTSFFMPHDLEISQTEMSEMVKLAKNYRSEDGETKRVNVVTMEYHHTCFFRARLFKLLSTFSNDPEQWVSSYIDSIPLRRPYHASDLIENKMGSFTLGSDVLNFLKRNFPHLTVMSKERVGDRPEDFYYESDLIRDVTSHSANVEDDTEMRDMLKAYFTAQIYGEKPCEWDFQDPEAFILKDKQLLADLLFFETSGHRMRSLLLAIKLQGSCDGYFSIDPEEPESFGTVRLENFSRMEPDVSVQGEKAEGSIIHIVKENAVKETAVLSRAFVVTPFGSIIEPGPMSYTCLKTHTADHVEFWAKKTVDLGEERTTAGTHGTAHVRGGDYEAA